MIQSILLSAILMLSLPTFADNSHTHTPNVCSTKNPDVCAHLGIYGELKSTVANQFIVDIMTPDGSPFTNLKVTLWMPDMGHGSSPVSLQDMGHNHYLVKDAWFIMPGQWSVRLNFDFNGENLDIEIPVEIAE